MRVHMSYPSTVVSHRSSFGLRTSFLSKPSGRRLNTLTSGARDGACITSSRVLSPSLLRELPSPCAEADVAIRIRGRGEWGLPLHPSLCGRRQGWHDQTSTYEESLLRSQGCVPSNGKKKWMV